MDGFVFEILTFLESIQLFLNSIYYLKSKLFVFIKKVTSEVHRVHRGTQVENGQTSWQFKKAFEIGRRNHMQI